MAEKPVFSLSSSIELGIDEKTNAKILVQGNVGKLNFTETGNIQANQQTNSQNSNEVILSLAKELITILKEVKIENTADKEDAIDFVQEATNTIASGEHLKPSVIRRARESLSKIRPTVEDASYLAIQIDKVVQAFSNLPF
ncbi:hypothetical protein [Bacillus thuringiensis]|uniref:hypothetical protein n=1 Tax=Bacillus thuringiensis TaxID=1428 RepID=UPI0011A5876A|nr:hypothetical protein [Bacillus thuringiensis]